MYRNQPRQVADLQLQAQWVLTIARRTTQTTAHLVEQVIRHVPVRQWVVSLPIPMRLLLAAQPELVTIETPSRRGIQRTCVQENFRLDLP